MKKQKSLTNKGFSLVELIIVVAIMAILIAILAPQYLRYVERSRLQKDNSAIDEVVNAIKVASADEDIIEEIAASDPIKFTFNSTYNAAGVAGTDAANTGVDCDKYDGVVVAQLISEIENTVGPLDTIGLSSNTYRNNGPVEVTVNVDSSTNILTITANVWYTKINQTTPDPASGRTF